MVSDIDPNAALPNGEAGSEPRLLRSNQSALRPRGASMLGWASGITGMAKFTFIPDARRASFLVPRAWVLSEQFDACPAIDSRTSSSRRAGVR